MTTLEEELLHTFEEPADEAEREAFALADDRMAVWALRKLQHAQKALFDLESQATREIVAIEEWLERESFSHKRTVAYFEHLLTQYGERARAEGRKTVTLHNGTIASKAGAVRWTLDKDRFLEWARTNRPDLIRVTEEPALLSDLKAAFKPAREPSETPCEAVDETAGVLIPGISITRGQPTVTVKTNP